MIAWLTSGPTLLPDEVKLKWIYSAPAAIAQDDLVCPSHELAGGDQQVDVVSGAPHRNRHCPQDAAQIVM